MPEDIEIYVDTREVRSQVVNELRQMECSIEEQSLQVGDFIVSDRIGIERKTVDDFLSSIFDKRLFKQLDNMSCAYEKPILVIEGADSLYSKRDIHPNVIRGVLSSIAVDLSVPMIWSRSERDSALIIYWMAKREQKENKRNVTVRGQKKPKSLKERQLFLVSGLPGIDRIMGDRLLDEFKTPENIFTADKESLMQVDGIGEKTAERLRKIITKELKCRSD